MLEISFNAEKAIAAMQQAPGRTQRATMRALNRAVASGRTFMTRLIAKDLGVSQKTARGQVWTVQATPDRLEVRMLASLRRVALIKLKPRVSRRGVVPRSGGDVVYQKAKGDLRPADLSRAFL